MWTLDDTPYPDIDALCDVIAARHPGHRVGRHGDFISVHQVDLTRPGYRGRFVAGFDILIQSGRVVPSTRVPAVGVWS